MATEVNGVSATVDNVEFEKDGVVHTNITQVELDGTIVWCKKYNLSGSKGSGVSTIIVNRTATQMPGAPLGKIYEYYSSASRADIYHGDQLSVSATPDSDYILNSYQTTYTVEGSLTIKVTASPKYDPERVTITTSVINSGGYYYENVYVYNNTGYPITVTAIRNSALNNGDYSKTIPPGTTMTFTKSSQLSFPTYQSWVTYTCNGMTYTKVG